MARKPTSNAWQWSRSAETRRVLLAAAREVFAAHGYDGASIADVVERAGSSVGSLYHHFGGKAELFVALWQDHQYAQEQRVVSAVAKARARSALCTGAPGAGGPGAEGGPAAGGPAAGGPAAGGPAAGGPAAGGPAAGGPAAGGPAAGGPAAGGPAAGGPAAGGPAAEGGPGGQGEAGGGEEAGSGTDLLTLFIEGARAYFEGSWEQRDVARLFMTGDGPPGFEMMRRTRSHEWIRQNAVLLGAGADPVDRMTVAILTTIIGEAAREIAASSSREEANALADAAVTLIRRLDPLRPSVPRRLPCRPAFSVGPS